MLDIGLFAAAAAGLLSFLSPCVLPLVPPYLTWLAGSSLEEISGDGTLVRLRIWMIATSVARGVRAPSGSSADFTFWVCVKRDGGRPRSRQEGPARVAEGPHGWRRRAGAAKRFVNRELSNHGRCAGAV
jgi:hypothetical protein